MGRNSLANSKNHYQGTRKRILCVCSAGLLRSPTAAFILSNEPFNFNTRACGITEEYALIPITETLVYWADEIICMNETHKNIVLSFDKNKIVHNLEVEDNYEFRQPELIVIMDSKLKEIFKN